MIQKIHITTALILLVSACGTKNTTNTGKENEVERQDLNHINTANNSNTGGEREHHRDIDAPTVTVKDLSQAQGLRPSVPNAAATNGWSVKVRLIANPKDLPSIRPDINKEYYQIEKTIGGKLRSISVVFGDLLAENDAIVNAANTSLEGGGGIDGQVHDKALVNGVDLMKQEGIAYKALHNVAFKTGSAMVMAPYGLAPNISMVVFAVGPNTTAPNEQNKLELYSTVYNSLLKAAEYGAKSVSIPAISTGIFGFPKQLAAELYFKAALQYFVDNETTSIERVRFINFDNINEPQKNKIGTVRSLAEAFVKLFP